MDFVENIWGILSPSIVGTECEFPLIVSMGIAFLGGSLAKKRCEQRSHRLCIFGMSAAAVIVTWNTLMKWYCGFAYALAALIATISVLAFFVPFLQNVYGLRESKKLCDQHSYVDAWNRLEKLRINCLTKKQRLKYQKRRFYLLVRLGNPRKAKVYLKEICSKKNAFYHFGLHIAAFYSGNLQASFCEIQAAADSDDHEDDPLLSVQIVMNYGVCYVTKGDFHLADEYYRKAIALYDKCGIKDQELLGTLYYNYAFNLLRLDPDGGKWEKALEECEAKLNMDELDAKVCVLNLRLELARQNEASREIIEGLLKDGASTLAECDLPLKNQLHVASSMARIAWAGRTDPIPYLSILKDNITEIDALPPDQRYDVYNGLETIFRDLYGPQDDPLTVLRDRVSEYMGNEAMGDLLTWRDSLPEDAVYARCDCLRKIAGLRRNQLPYDIHKIVRLQENIASLCHGSELYVEELHAYQDIVDELLSECSRNEDHQPKYVDQIVAWLSKTKELLAQLEGHPALAEAYVRLSAYYFSINEYEKGVDYTRRFWKTGVSIQNFAPWVRRYYAIELLQTRVILFDQAIKDAAADKGLRMQREDIQAWFATYPRHDGLMEMFLLKRFLHTGRGKIKIWIPDGKREPETHTWFYMDPLALNIDLTYPQFADDPLCNCVFFYQDRHPFESETSVALCVSRRNNPLIFGGITDLPPEAVPAGAVEAQADALYDFICRHISDDCPKIEDIASLFQEFMQPIPIRHRATDATGSE